MDVKPPAALGPLSDWTIPQGFFAHFYAVGAAWNVLVTALFVLALRSSSSQANLASVVALALLQVHLVRRYVETVALMKYPQGARMHGVAYLFGLRCAAIF